MAAHSSGLTQARSELPLLAAAWRSWSCATPEGRCPRRASLNQWLATRETLELVRRRPSRWAVDGPWLLAELDRACGVGGDGAGRWRHWPFYPNGRLAPPLCADALRAFAYLRLVNQVMAALGEGVAGPTAGRRLLGALAICGAAAVGGQCCDEASRRTPALLAIPQRPP